MGHGKVMPPNTRDRALITTYLMHMAEKLGARLRRHDMEAQHFFVGLRSYEHGWIGGKYKTLQNTQDGKVIYQLCRQVLETRWQGQPVGQVQVTALDPKAAAQQLDLFLDQNPEREQINDAIDDINQRFGELTLAPARLLGRSSMPNVIAPAWKPDGHRETIGG